jgi:hypothetical protein
MSKVLGLDEKARLSAYFRVFPDKFRRGAGKRQKVEVRRRKGGTIRRKWLISRICGRGK